MAWSDAARAAAAETRRRHGGLSARLKQNAAENASKRYVSGVGTPAYKPSPHIVKALNELRARLKVK